jgi:predicted DCC family thiol-disulfide oxidoreductase YuxK
MIHEDTLLLDGDCGLCNRVAIILHPRLDNDKNLRFLTNESEEGKKIIDELSTKKQKADTVYLIRNGESFIRSAAAIRCLLYLKWYYKMWYPFVWIIPLPLRDIVYSIISKNRHKIFSKPEVCTIPSLNK